MPRCMALKREMISVTYSFSTSGKFILEDKELLRKRLGYSTDRGDALALTFALEEMPAGSYKLDSVHSNVGKAIRDYDPFKDA